jgi:hypothetical protein
MTPPANDGTPFHDVAYPSELRKAEEDLLRRRPGWPGTARVGVAISGGGIRSATFALGVFQALSSRRLLGRIDYLSTVSGGGYFGAFLGRLFTRGYVTSAKDVEDILTGPPVVTPYQPAALGQATWKVIGWLRENGRYLSPRGAGDLLLGAAVLLRNWLSVHIVLGMLILTIFQAMQLPRIAAFHLVARDPANSTVEAVVALQWRMLEKFPLSDWIWWSPWIYLGLALLSVSFPFFGAYWLIGRPVLQTAPAGSGRMDRTLRFAQRRSARLGAFTAVIIGLFGVAMALWLPDAKPAEAFDIATGTAIAVGVVAGAALVIPRWGAIRAEDACDALDLRDPDARRLFIEAETRHWVSVKATRWLIVGGAVLAVAMVDSLAQSIYASAQDGTLKRWVAGIVAALGGLAAAARRSWCWRVARAGTGVRGCRSRSLPPPSRLRSSRRFSSAGRSSRTRFRGTSVPRKCRLRSMPPPWRRCPSRRRHPHRCASRSHPERRKPPKPSRRAAGVCSRGG